MSYTANPSLQHTIALKRILRYLSSTRSYGIVYKVLPQSPSFFHGYLDVALANADEAKSTSGYVYIARNGVITWSSKRQISQALSSAEAEYVTISEAARKACWLWNLYTELGLLDQEMPTEIHGDNEASLTMARNPQFHKHTKHINTHWHWIQRLICAGIITVESCHDPEQTADVLTKVLLHQKHEKHAQGMGLVPI